MADEGGLGLDGLLARLRQLGVAPIQRDADAPLWLLKSREGDVLSIRNPTYLSPEQRLEVWKEVKRKADPFGRNH